MPLGAFISSGAHMSALRSDPPLSHVTTFGGHPVSCAAAHAALSVIISENLPARANELGRRIRERLRGPGIVEVRGRGAMLGLLLQDASLTARVVKRCLDAGVLLGWTLHSDRLIRIAPHLNIDWEVLDFACEVIKDSVAQEQR